MKITRFHRTVAAAAVLGAALVGCTDDDAVPAGAEVEPASGTIEITGVDYGFTNVPPVIEAGSELTFTNVSETEMHELVLVKRPEGEERPVDEILALPPEEAFAAVEFKGVSIAMPGEDGEVVDGSLVLDEPGTYILVCNIPVGMDPADMEGGPVEGGTPHHQEGMVLEFEVV